MPLSYVESNKTPFLYFALRGRIALLQRPLPFPPPETPINLPQPMRTPNFSSIRSGCWARIDRTGAGRLQQKAVICVWRLVHGAGYGLLLSYALLCLSRAGVRYSRSGRDARTDADALDATDVGFDDNHIENIFTPRLKSFLVKARYDIGFRCCAAEIGNASATRRKMGHIIENYCGSLRLEL